MTIQDWDEVLKFVDALTRWPVVALYLALLFRPTIARKMSGLEKIKVKETEVNFSRLKKIASVTNADLLKEVILKVRPDALAEGEADADESSVADEEEDAAISLVEVDEGSAADEDADSERVELEEVQQKLARLKEAGKPDEL